MRSAREDGFTLLELTIASAVALVVVVAAALGVTATERTAEAANETATTTGPALEAANAVEQVLTNAFVPAGVPPTLTSQCSTATDATLGSANGPFVSGAETSSTTLWICSLLPGTSSPYTYDIHFSACSAAGVCTLDIDREPAPGCLTSCNPTTVEAFSGLSDTSTTPFTYYTDNPWGITSTLSAIESVVVDLQTPTLHGRGSAAEVKRTVVLPNTLGGQA